MNNSFCRRVNNVYFWNGYAKWYKSWIEHNSYHDRIVEVLINMVEPGWRVLDIGAGIGVLTLPLCSIYCDVLALEPSINMRDFLYREAFSRGIDWINVDDRRWEDVPIFELEGFDLVIACNSLHLTSIGFKQALEKVFQTKPKNIFLVTEFEVSEWSFKFQKVGYTMSFMKSYQIESSFAYHTKKEVEDHWSYIKGKKLNLLEIGEIEAKLVYQKGHMWLKDKACVYMYWWEKNNGISA